MALKATIHKDRLFLLNPNFKDERLGAESQFYFCPFNAMLEGVLHYYPELKDKLDITYVDFPRPRKPIIHLLGEENQGTPVLVLPSGQEHSTQLPVQQYRENRFIHGSEGIAAYLAEKYGIALIHP